MFLLSLSFVIGDEIGCCSNPAAGTSLCSKEKLVQKDAKCCPKLEGPYSSYYYTKTGLPFDYVDCINNFFFVGQDCGTVDECETGCCCSPDSNELKVFSQCKGKELTFLPGIEDCDNYCYVAECNDGIDNDGNGCTDFPEDSSCLSTNDLKEDGSGCIIDSSATFELKAESGTVAYKTTCDGLDYSCEINYDYCGEIGQYTIWFTADGITTSQNSYYCDCIGEASKCSNKGRDNNSENENKCIDSNGDNRMPGCDSEFESFEVIHGDIKSNQTAIFYKKDVIDVPGYILKLKYVDLDELSQFFVEQGIDNVVIHKDDSELGAKIRDEIGINVFIIFPDEPTETVEDNILKVSKFSVFKKFVGVFKKLFTFIRLS